MHTTIQTQVTAVIAFVMTMMGLMFALSVFTESHQQIAVNSAVQAAMLDSRDDNSRAYRGVYAINKNVLEQDLDPNGKYNSYVEKWRKRNYNDVQVKAFYLVDTSTNSTKYTKANHRPGSIPVKGVKIMITGKKGNGPEKVLDTASFVISSNVVLAPHNQDVTGDDVNNQQLPTKVIQ